MEPTGWVRSRGVAAGGAGAKELGLSKLTVPAAGNAAGALGAYCARAGMECHVFMPEDAPEANKKETEIAGARLTLVEGLISDAAARSREAAARLGLFDVSTLREPYRVEGKKTMGYEIAQDLGWRLPGAIV